MFIEANGVVLHANQFGDYNNPLIVFSNSLGTDGRIWDEVIARLLDRYRVLTYDTRGHGLSEAPRGPYRIDDLAQDLLGLVDQLDEQRFALVGISVGGMVAQRFAAGQPERVAALVLCDTSAKIGDPDSWNARIEAVEDHGVGAIADGVLARWFTPGYHARESVAMHGWHAMLTRQPPNGYAATCAAIRDADLREAVASIQIPTLCVVGDGDLATPPDEVRATADLIPNARFEIVDNAGHLPCIEQPDALATLILQHLGEAGY